MVNNTLSDEQIYDLWVLNGGSLNGNNYVAFARALLAATPPEIQSNPMGGATLSGDAARRVMDSVHLTSDAVVCAVPGEWIPTSERLPEVEACTEYANDDRAALAPQPTPAKGLDVAKDAVCRAAKTYTEKEIELGWGGPDKALVEALAVLEAVEKTNG